MLTKMCIKTPAKPRWLIRCSAHLKPKSSRLSACLKVIKIFLTSTPWIKAWSHFLTRTLKWARPTWQLFQRQEAWASSTSTCTWKQRSAPRWISWLATPPMTIESLSGLPLAPSSTRRGARPSACRKLSKSRHCAKNHRKKGPKKHSTRAR